MSPSPLCRGVWALCSPISEIPAVCDSLPYMAEDMTKLGILRGGAFPGLSAQVLTTIMFPWAERQRNSGDRHIRRRQCEGGDRGCRDVATNQGMPAASRSWERGTTGSLPELLVEHNLAPAFTLTSALRNCEGMDFRCLKPPVCGTLLQQPQEPNTLGESCCLLPGPLRRSQEEGSFGGHRRRAPGAGHLPLIAETAGQSFQHCPAFCWESRLMQWGLGGLRPFLRTEFARACSRGTILSGEELAENPKEPCLILIFTSQETGSLGNCRGLWERGKWEKQAFGST